MPEKYAIITAGGQGSRMGTSTPKQFLELGGLPVIMHSMQAFYNYSRDIHIIVVIPEEQMGMWNSLSMEYGVNIKHSICFGGKTRFHSVENALGLVPFDSFVAVHDAARPLLSQALIRKCFELAQQNGNAVPAIPLVDSIREVRGEENRPVDRTLFRLVQTPQVFDSNLIKKAYQQAYRASFTDDASVLESIGVPINLIEGERKNIKITTLEDLIVAQAYLKEKPIS